MFGAGTHGRHSEVHMDTPEELLAADRQRERWRAIVVEIFRYSTQAGDEAHILEEGALRVIDQIGRSELHAASLADLRMAT